LLSVPMQEVENALNDFLPYISKGSLVVDNSSVKSETLKILLEKVPVDVELASIHTMFGPSEESLKGKNVIFTETGRAGKLAHELERVFYKYGAIITHVSVEEHDKRVAYTQAIVHFISLGFGSFLNSEQVQLDVIKPFLTPNTERLLLNMNRALSQSRELSQGILVDNTFSKSLREVFLKSLAETNAAIDSEELAAQLDLLLKFKP